MVDAAHSFVVVDMDDVAAEPLPLGMEMVLSSSSVVVAAAEVALLVVVETE
jgi:hypothetical protein